MFGLDTHDIHCTHRDPNHDPEKLKEHVGDVVNELIALERRTNPVDGEKTSENKDFNASRALQLAGELVESLAGWAIDHQIGLGIEVCSSVSEQPGNSKPHPDYLAAKVKADNHRHEAAGSEYNYEASFKLQRGSSDAERQMMINLLRALSNAFPHGLVYGTIEALEALEYGEVQPLLAPSSTTLGKHGFSLWNLRLQALECVEYYTAQGYTRKASQSMVADAVGRASETVRDWGKKVRSLLGNLKVDSRLASAKIAGKYVKAAKRKGDARIPREMKWLLVHDGLHGERGLERIAKAHTALLRKNQPEKS